MEGERGEKYNTQEGKMGEEGGGSFKSSLGPKKERGLKKELALKVLT